MTQRKISPVAMGADCRQRTARQIADAWHRSGEMPGCAAVFYQDGATVYASRDAARACIAAGGRFGRSQSAASVEHGADLIRSDAYRLFMADCVADGRIVMRQPRAA